MRLQKFMADAGVASRRKCEEFIAQGRVRVNGNVAALGSVVEEGDRVEFDGRVLRADTEKVLIAFNKPLGVVCTTRDPEGRATVMDFFRDYPTRLYNVGRLDYDSEGLLLMTNNGDLANRLLHPKYNLDKTYHAVVNGTLTPESAQFLARGVLLEDGMTFPAKVSGIRRLKNGNTALNITIHEGRNRQVRRMFAAVGHETLLLRRISIGNIRLEGLEPGAWRLVSEAEIRALNAMLT